MQEITTLIREFGFPTLFCLWLMWRDGKKTDVQIATMNKMLLLLTVLVKTSGINIDDDEVTPITREIRKEKAS